MLANICQVHDLFEIPEFYPLEDWDETELLECIAVKWEHIDNPALKGILEQRVECRRPRYVDEGLVDGDFSLEYDFSQEYPIEVGSFAVAILDDVDFAGIVRHVNEVDNWVEIEYFDTELDARGTIEVSLNAVEVILP